MTKKLTEGQKLARAAVRAAAKKVIQEMDMLKFRKECVYFEADFHLGCWRYDQGYFGGEPSRSGMPVYQRVTAGRYSPNEQERHAARLKYISAP